MGSLLARSCTTSVFVQISRAIQPIMFVAGAGNGFELTAVAARLKVPVTKTSRPAWGRFAMAVSRCRSGNQAGSAKH